MCRTCRPGFFRNGTGNAQSPHTCTHIEHCLLQTSLETCEVCRPPFTTTEEGGAARSSRCVETIPFCRIQASGTVCRECAAGYYHTQVLAPGAGEAEAAWSSQCERIAGCESVNETDPSQCDRCEPSFTLLRKAGHPDQCTRIEHCASVNKSNPRRCDRCEVEYFRLEMEVEERDTCVRAIEHCLYYGVTQFECLLCAEGYLLVAEGDAHACQQRIAGCLQYSATGAQCLVCNASLVLV